MTNQHIQTSYKPFGLVDDLSISLDSFMADFDGDEVTALPSFKKSSYKDESYQEKKLADLKEKYLARKLTRKQYNKLVLEA